MCLASSKLALVFHCLKRRIISQTLQRGVCMSTDELCSCVGLVVGNKVSKVSGLKTVKRLLLKI